MVIEHEFPQREPTPISRSFASRLEAHDWHLDKRLPVAMIITIVFQMAMGVWWASKLDSRVSQLEQSQQSQRDRDQLQDRVISENEARIERQTSEAVQLVRAHLDRIDAKLDRLIEARADGKR